jgi:predicted lipid-binding transport protein (Tim44 family)
MDIPTLVMAYGAAALVALTVTAAFSTPIEEVLFRLLPEEVAPAWQQFVKFALFVATFVGGMPAPLAGAIIDRNAPAAPPPAAGESFMVVMSSLSGALMSGTRLLLVFFAITLAALGALRIYTMMRKRRELEANRIAEREEERKQDKALQDSGQPLKRREPSEARPVKQERPAQNPKRW